MNPVETDGLTKEDALEMEYKARKAGFKSFTLEAGSHTKEYPINDLRYAYGIKGLLTFSKQKPKH